MRRRKKNPGMKSLGNRSTTTMSRDGRYQNIIREGTYLRSSAKTSLDLLESDPRDQEANLGDEQSAVPRILGLRAT
jgi:hypothetical protein